MLLFCSCYEFFGLNEQVSKIESHVETKQNYSLNVIEDPNSTENRNIIYIESKSKDDEKEDHKQNYTDINAHTNDVDKHRNEIYFEDHTKTDTEIKSRSLFGWYY